MVLATTDIRPLEAKLRFRLGVGLAKLGLFDLSLRHVSLSATPWEAPLYRLRAKLVFPPVHSSVRSVALAVGNFERQGESIISTKEPASPLMVPICEQLKELSLALQVWPHRRPRRVLSADAPPLRCLWQCAAAAALTRTYP